MSDRSVTELRRMGRRAPAVLLLFALVALIAGVCHGAHGHSLSLAQVSAAQAPAVAAPAAAAPAAAVTASAPGLPHGCERPGEGWSFDAHLPAQSAGAQYPAPQAAAAALAYDEMFPQAPDTRCVRGRAGPGPRPGSLLISLGVDRN